jgi:structural maintenance of chromosomes protein 5
MQRVRAVVKDLLHAELVRIEAESDVASLEARNSDMTRLLKEKEREEATLKVETVRVKRLAVEHRQAAFDTMQELDEDMQIMQRAFLERYEDPTMDQLEAEATSTRGRLELVSPGDPRVLAEYEKRAGEIEEAGRLLTSVDSIVEEKGRKIDETRARWEPRVDRLVERISKAFTYNFEQIGCAGSVAVHKDEAYSKWAILIQVRFRYILPPRLFSTERADIQGAERASNSHSSTRSASPAASAPSARSST